MSQRSMATLCLQSLKIFLTCSQLQLSRLFEQATEFEEVQEMLGV